MNTLRQLAARIARQCAVSVACIFNAVCGMQRCCPPPPRRKFEIIFALRRIGILAGFAVCILTFAAPDAQAQTSCEAGERLVTNFGGSGCFPNDKVDIADDCLAAGWGIESGRISSDELSCDIGSRLYGGRRGNACGIEGLDRFYPSCTEMYGDPPKFPNAAGDDGRFFVANCSLGGTIPGAIPATINTIAAKNCTCGASGYVGDYPDCTCPGLVVQGVCTCPDGQAILADGVSCGVCPGGQTAQSGFCTCPVGQVITDSGCSCVIVGQSIVNGGCTCPDNHVILDGLCIPEDGDFGELSDAVLCEVFGGDVFRESLPQEAEELIRRVNLLAQTGGFSAADRAVYVAMMNAIQAKFNRDHEAVNTFLSAYDTGGANYKADIYSNIILAASHAYDSGTFNTSNSNELARILARVPVSLSGKICSGMDSNDTFCIIDSADAFPCRGLFKHLRSCNVQFNRKALNPFFCGEKCGAQKAVGSECR